MVDRKLEKGYISAPEKIENTKGTFQLLKSKIAKCPYSFFHFPSWAELWPLYEFAGISL